MVLIIVRHKVKDFNEWNKSFHEHLDLMKQHGAQSGKILRNINDLKEIIVYLQWDKAENFKKFAEESQKRMQQTGEDSHAQLLDTPDGYFLEEVEQLEF